MDLTCVCCAALSSVGFLTDDRIDGASAEAEWIFETKDSRLNGSPGFH